MPVPRVRPRKPSDLAACLAVLGRVHQADGYPTHWPSEPRRFVAPPYERRAWVAIDRDQVTGHVALHHPTQDPACPVAQAAAGVGDDRLVAVARLFADVDRRGAHLGDRLLENATGAAHREGRRPFLNVVTHLTRAIALYQRHGWDDLGPLSIPFPDGTSLDVLVFLGPPPP